MTDSARTAGCSPTPRVCGTQIAPARLYGTSQQPEYSAAQERHKASIQHCGTYGGQKGSTCPTVASVWVGVGTGKPHGGRSGAPSLGAAASGTSGTKWLRAAELQLSTAGRAVPSSAGAQPRARFSSCRSQRTGRNVPATPW
eukprot:scaffold162577_cov31-Tisochrysis_lutea.AAC.4